MKQFEKLKELTKMEMGSLIGGYKDGDREPATSGCTPKFSSDTYQKVYHTHKVSGKTVGYFVLDEKTFHADETDFCKLGSNTPIYNPTTPADKPVKP